MELCLSHPLYGYYGGQNKSNYIPAHANLPEQHLTPQIPTSILNNTEDMLDQHILGRRGDFITSPEVSQLFGEMIALWSLHSSEKFAFNQAPIINLIELGPGNGTMMADMLRVFRKFPSFLSKLRIRLVDISPHFISLQKKSLEPFAPLAVFWHADLAAALRASEGHPIIIVANEFLDTLPVDQYYYRPQEDLNPDLSADISPGINQTPGKDLNLKQHWHQLQVHVPTPDPDSWQLIWQLAEEVPKYVQERAFPNTKLEYSSAIIETLEQVAQALCTQGGAALFIDYGYIENNFGSSEQTIDTLQAVKDHNYCSLLANPGEVDITAHVNFSTIYDILCTYKGIHVTPVLSQENFLRQMGIDQRYQALLPAAANADDFTSAYQRLIHDMGRVLFKALSCGKAPLASSNENH